MFLRKFLLPQLPKKQIGMKIGSLLALPINPITSFLISPYKKIPQIALFVVDTHIINSKSVKILINSSAVFYPKPLTTFLLPNNM